ncbi:MAG: 50S ribosome-binding GTPase [Thermoleophilia bacterium]|nr:50S ribosome-binding GTPase [Thermoleophilia bacterium]
MPVESPMLHAVAVGSVDDGKSTLIGRLLYETGHLNADEIAHVEEASRKRGRKFLDLALLTDGLRAEREQGITIDVAYRSFDAQGRRILLGDAPGHEQYTRNMVTAAAGADVAILLVDAANGLTSQTRRHLAICAMLGVEDVIACVNKIDLVDYDEGRFTELADELRAASKAVDGPRITAIPLSALEGINITQRSDKLPWYPGPTVLEVLHDLDRLIAEEAFRMPVQWVTRYDEGGADVRALAGRITSGTVRVGDEVVALPGGKSATVSAIDVLGEPRDMASAPLSVALHLATDIDVSRGDVMAPVADPPQVATRVKVTIAWLDEAPLTAPARLEVRQSARLVPAIVEQLHERLDLDAMKHEQADALEANDLGIATLLLAQPLVVQPYAANREMGSMVLVDPGSNRTVGAVMVTEVLDS